MKNKKQLTEKQRKRQYRNNQIRIFYDSLPEELRSVRRVAIAFDVSKSTVAYAVNGRKK
jgi:hypothetical protein